MTFTPVTLKPLDDNQKKALLASADSPTKIYTVTFKLSGGPIQEWSSVFQNAWYSANNDNDARVVGNTMQLHSTIDKIPDAVVKLNAAIAAANRKFEELQKIKAENEATQKKTKDDAKVAAQNALKSALDKIDYSK